MPPLNLHLRRVNWRWRRFIRKLGHFRNYMFPFYVLGKKYLFRAPEINSIEKWHRHTSPLKFSLTLSTTQFTFTSLMTFDVKLCTQICLVLESLKLRNCRCSRVVVVKWLGDNLRLVELRTIQCLNIAFSLSGNRKMISQSSSDINFQNNSWFPL